MFGKHFGKRRTGEMSPKRSATDELELRGERAELKAGMYELHAERAEFRAMKLEWEATRGGGSSDDRQLDFAKAKLEADILQMEDEKMQLRFAQIQVKVAQFELEDAKSKLEAALTQLEEAKNQLETTRWHLEAAKAQTDISDNLRLNAAKAGLEAANMRFEAATEQLKDAEDKFESAKTQLRVIASNTTLGSGTCACARLEEENVNLRIQVIGQLQSDISKVRALSKMENDKLKLETDLKASRAEVQLLEVERARVSKVESENAELKITVSKLENEKSKLVSELQQSKIEVQRLSEKLEEVTKLLDDCDELRKRLERKVFLDIAINGRNAGRIVIELDFYTTPLTAENFRLLCTGERGIGRSGKPLHYKGTKFYRTIVAEDNIQGGDVTTNDGHGGDSIYGPTFTSENFTNKHTGPGIVPMAHNGSNPPVSNGSRFLISTAARSSSDGTNVVFGRVIEGMNVVMGIKNAGNGASVIADCGQLLS